MNLAEGQQVAEKSNLIAGRYTLADLREIKRLANATIQAEVKEWFPDRPPERFTLSDAQVRHVLIAQQHFEALEQKREKP